jgi:hypothetical protein
MQICAWADTFLPTEKEINIEVGLTEMQWKRYRSVLEKDIDVVNGRLLLDFARFTHLICSKA